MADQSYLEKIKGLQKGSQEGAEDSPLAAFEHMLSSGTKDVAPAMVPKLQPKPVEAISPRAAALQDADRARVEAVRKGIKSTYIPPEPPATYASDPDISSAELVELANQANQLSDQQDQFRKIKKTLGK